MNSKAMVQQNSCPERGAMWHIDDCQFIHIFRDYVYTVYSLPYGLCLYFITRDKLINEAIK